MVQRNHGIGSGNDGLQAGSGPEGGRHY